MIDCIMAREPTRSSSRDWTDVGGQRRFAGVLVGSLCQRANYYDNNNNNNGQHDDNNIFKSRQATSRLRAGPRTELNGMGRTMRALPARTAIVVSLWHSLAERRGGPKVRPFIIFHPSSGAQVAPRPLRWWRWWELSLSAPLLTAGPLALISARQNNAIESTSVSSPRLGLSCTRRLIAPARRNVLKASPHYQLEWRARGQRATEN